MIGICLQYRNNDGLLIQVKNSEENFLLPMTMGFGQVEKVEWEIIC